MKKLLSIFAAVGITSASAATVISCAQREILSIGNKENVFKIDDSYFYDITKWKNDVVSSDEYKNIVMSNLDQITNGPGGNLNFTKLVETTKIENKEVSIVSKLISDYQKSSNDSPDEKDKSNWENPEFLDNEFEYEIYDFGDSEAPVLVAEKESGSSQWKDKASNDQVEKDDQTEQTYGELKAIKNESTGAYVLHFKVAVKPKDDSQFIGAKLNLVNEVNNKDSSQVKIDDFIEEYYINRGIKKDLSNISEGKENLAINLNDEDKLSTGEFNYMFDVLFHFNIN